MSNSSSGPVVELRQASKVYRRGVEEVHAVSGVSLSVAPGDFLSIVGASGSGKSTLLHLMGCVERPESGGVFFQGGDTQKMSDRELTGIRREKVGFVFQQFFLLPMLTALENVCVPALFARHRGAEARAKELLDRVGLAKRMRHRPGELSGGEMQRVAVARALMNGPALLLADEPTGNLDTASAESIYELLTLLNRDGPAVVVVTHNEVLARRAKTVLRMHDGKMEQ
jgi:ABC-type lipoprotein export system ATPase subunit